VLSGNPFILLIGILSFVVFFLLLGTRASKKQRERSNKINWSWLFNISKKTGKEPKIIDGESKEIKDDKDE
jgi:hypothetical protein